MKDFFVYTLARLGVFIATYAILWGVVSLVADSSRLINVWVLLIALIISSIISIFVLAPMRDRLASRIQQRAEALNERLEESRRAEDVD